MVCLPLFCVYTILLILNQNILNKILLALFLHYLTYVQLYSTSALQECSDTIACTIEEVLLNQNLDKPHASLILCWNYVSHQKHKFRPTNNLLIFLPHLA